jgi:pimeloyl-ACP methyl ester carboxylesterase
MTTLAFTRTGAGEPLVLLHPLGLSRSAWNPVIPALAEHFDVIAVDMPGFGDSAPLPAEVEPTPAALACAVAGLLDELGVATAHVAGNSLGGWVALELAAVRPVASLTLLSPAGLWRGATPLYCRVSLRATRWLSQHATGILNHVVEARPGRAVVFGQTLGRPTRLTPDEARTAIHAMATCPGFDGVLRATAPRHYRSSRPLAVPVAVAFGSRDRLLLRRQSRHLDELPPGVQITELPGCGHVPMTDDPLAVAAVLITRGRRPGRSDAYRGAVTETPA